jgi:hypothetical protein
MSRLAKIHARFDRMGVNEWAAAPPPGTPVGATCNHNYELTSESYDRVFADLKRAAGSGQCLTDLGAGCGRGVAHAVGSGAFRRAVGIEIVPLRVTAARAALRDLKLSERASILEGNFADYSVDTPAAACFDVAYDRATLRELARVLTASTECQAFVSFRPPSRWEADGLAGFEVASSQRVKTSGGERFTAFVYKRKKM